MATNALRHHRAAVTVFAGDFHHARNAGELFQLVTRHQARVVTGAAGHDVDLPDLAQDVVGADSENVRQHVVRADTALQGLSHGTRLLENLLLHVMAITAALHGVGRQVGLNYRPLDGLIGPITNPIAVGVQPDHVALLEVDEAVGHGKQGMNVGSKEMLVEADTQHQRAA